MAIAEPASSIAFIPVCSNMSGAKFSSNPGFFLRYTELGAAVLSANDSIALNSATTRPLYSKELKG
jgi:hypothetical protein